MVFVVALVVTVVLLVLMWRAIGPEHAAGSATAHRPRPVRRTAPVPPDDNPDFLRDLSRRARPED